MPSVLPGLWPKTDDGVKLSDLFSWFYGAHSFEEETQLGYPPELRPIPKVDYAIVKKAVSKAIQDGGLWLVYGNDSVLSEAPTALQMDATPSCSGRLWHWSQSISCPWLCPLRGQRTRSQRLPSPRSTPN